MPPPNNSFGHSKSQSSSGRSSRRRGADLRTDFQRYVWALVAVAIYLLIAIQWFDYVDDPDSSSSVWMLLAGVLISAVIGAVATPYIPLILGYKSRPKHRKRG